MEKRLKMIQDYILVTKETIFVLQQWLAWLDQVRGYDQLEIGEFEAICQQMGEAGLGNWLERASGHSLVALRQVVNEQTLTESIE